MPYDVMGPEWIKMWNVMGLPALWFTHLLLNKINNILADDNFGCIYLNENDRILIRISLKFVLSGPIDNPPKLVQVMAWRQTGDKP